MSIDRNALIKDFREWEKEVSPYAGNSWDQNIVQSAIYQTVGKAIRKIEEAPSGWVSVVDAMPKTIPCGAGTEYSEALIVWTSGRKILTAVYDGKDFICDAGFWEAEGEEILYWMQPEIPVEERSGKDGKTI